jgi:hypothetical protein
MKAKNFPQLALLSLVCVACVQNPLAQAPAASSAPNTPTPGPIQTPSISPPVQTPIAQEPAASPPPNTPTPGPIQTQSPNPTPVPTQTSLEVAQKPTNSLPPTQTYDLRVITNQLWRRLTKITFGEDSIIVTMAITNGSKEVVMLNGKDGMYLYDNYNQRYNLLPPSNNTQILIKPGTTLKGQFVFVGWLQPKAKYLGLYSTINDGSSITLFDNIPINR